MNLYEEVLSEMKKQMLFYNCKVYTINNELPTAEAIVAEKGEIIFVGSSAEAKANFPDAESVDLQGKFVFPGFIESHIHTRMYGEFFETIQLTGKAKEEIVGLVAERSAKEPEGKWIVGRGWNEEDWDCKALPSKSDIDSVSLNNPVCLRKYDGHMIWVNSAALRAAGIDDDSGDPVGGEIVRDIDGHVTGCLTGTAKNKVNELVLRKDKAGISKTLLRAQSRLLRYGVTSAQDVSTDEYTATAIRDLCEDGRMKIRFGIAPQITPENIESYMADTSLEPETNLFDEHFSNRALKILVDGSMSSHGAALREAYSDRPDCYGQLVFTDEQLARIIDYSVGQKRQLIAHCIGDAASEQFIRQVGACVPSDSSKYRFRIEHFHVAPDDLLEKVKSLGIVLSVQPTHGPSSPTIAVSRIGPRADYAYAYRKELDACSLLALGSDAPVSDPDPLFGIYAAVARKGRNRKPEGGFLVSGAITAEEALKGYTVWAAYAQFQEKRRGTIEVGKLADFVVLENDILECQTEEILDTGVLATVIGGEFAYRAEGF